MFKEHIQLRTGKMPTCSVVTNGSPITYEVCDIIFIIHNLICVTIVIQISNQSFLVANRLAYGIYFSLSEKGHIWVPYT